jgi:hypothetical protein
VSLGRLFPYIPFAGALVWNRNPSGGGPLKIHVSFSPDWFAARMGLDYGERWHRDPPARRESFAAMARALNREFPELRLGGEPEAIRGGLSQIDGCALTAALFGQEILFSPEGWPENRQAPLDDRAADRLKVPDVGGHPVVADLLRQIAAIEAEWGQADGELNYQGVLNTAFRLRGEQLFVDLVQEPERAHRVLGVVCDTMIELARLVYERQAGTGVHKDYFVTSNCVVNMISEEHYRRFVMPYDRRLAGAFNLFGVHNCGWNVDAYAAAYAELGVLEYLDFGTSSDLRRLRELFPGATLTPILNPEEVIGRARGEVRGLLRCLRESLGDCRIILGSLDSRTPAEDVISFFREASTLWEVPVEELVPQPHCG